MQIVIKLIVLGVFDIYQGSEVLNFSFVDFDNCCELDFVMLVQQLD